MRDPIHLQREDLERLAERRSGEVDTKADGMVLDMKQNLARRQASRRWRLFLLTVAIGCAAWVFIRLQIVKSVVYKGEMAWWLVAYPDAKSEASAPLTMDDVVLELEYPVVRTSLELVFASRQISAPGAAFLAQMVRAHGSVLRAVHWQGAGIDVAHFLDHPNPAGGHQCSRAEGTKAWEVVDVGMPWPDYMDAWNRKVWLVGGEHGEAGADAPSLETIRGEVHLLPASRRYWPDHDVKQGGKRCLNPWVDLFGFSRPDSMANSLVVQAYLCSANRSRTMLHILFQDGLVGVARKMTTGDTTAADLVSALMGMGGVPPPRACTHGRVMRGMDIFMTGTGVASMAAPFIPGAGLGFAALGAAVSAGAGGVVGALHEC